MSGNNFINIYISCQVFCSSQFFQMIFFGFSDDSMAKSWYKLYNINIESIDVNWQQVIPPGT